MQKAMRSHEKPLAKQCLSRRNIHVGPTSVFTKSSFFKLVLRACSSGKAKHRKPGPIPSRHTRAKIWNTQIYLADRKTKLTWGPSCGALNMPQIYIYNIYISLWTKKTHPRWTFAKEQIISEVNIGNACCRPNGKTIHFGNHYVPLSPSLSQGVQRLRVAKSLHFVFWCLSYSNISSILL
jgi:hypothetical protein